MFVNRFMEIYNTEKEDTSVVLNSTRPSDESVRTGSVNWGCSHRVKCWEPLLPPSQLPPPPQSKIRFIGGGEMNEGVLISVLRISLIASSLSVVVG